MTTAFTPMSFVPAQRAADPDAAAAPAPPLMAVPSDGTAVTAEDHVLLPRHIADAAYQVVHAIQALKDDGGLQLFRVLGAALDKTPRVHAVFVPPCDACHIDVAQGLAHHPECWSDEAARYRSMPLPQVDLYD